MNATTKQTAPGGRKRTSPPRGKEEGSNSQPRYLQVASELKRGISDGSWPVGARLPTEVELCEQFDISRFTARAAVRVLALAGLITRRQRVGTVVIATPENARYTHDMSTARDLLQYAEDTELKLMFVSKVPLSKAQAREVGARPGDEWIYALGLRNGPGAADARPICVTRLFLNPVLKGIEGGLRDRKAAIYAIIERDFKRPIERIEQDLKGVLLDAEDAANLGAKPGAPALRILRRYYGDDGLLLELSDNVHPSDRFTYHMHLRK
jgi:GntR family transcriptional regulator